MVTIITRCSWVAISHQHLIDEETENIVMEQYKKALSILENSMAKVHTVAKKLFEEEKIDGEVFRSIMAE